MAEMAVNADQLVTGLGTNNFENENPNRRGLNVYYFSELQGIAGKDKYGKLIQGNVERPLWGLSVEDRLDIFKRCDVIFGVVTSRMNKIATMEWSIEKNSKDEDRIVENIKSANQLYLEYNDPNNLAWRVFQTKMFQLVKSYLVDIKPDMSNFQTALLRWKRNIKNNNSDVCEQVTEWLQEPNIEDTFTNYLKKFCFDLLIHGGFAQYKEYCEGLLENFYGLPGGSIMPLKSRYVGGGRAYLQMIQGMDAKIYFEDEVSFCNYIPATGMSYGNVPLEALVNKIAESLLFDQLMAERADGTKPPEKAVIFGGQYPFGELTNSPDESYQMPIPAQEQKRVETLLNEPRKNAIRTLTGIGHPLVLDLSKADTMASQQERQRLLREVVGLVYGATPIEMNMADSSGTSGRATSEEQSRIDRERSIYPIMQIIETVLNTEILPLRWPSDYKFNFKSGMSDSERLEIERLKVESQTYSINEVRNERGSDPFDGKEYDLPSGMAAKAPDGSEGSPLNTRSIL
jgi:hypothetical protein